jgi:hypothetical protein
VTEDEERPKVTWYFKNCHNKQNFFWDKCAQPDKNV